MKKRLLTMLLALLMIMSMVPFAAMADEAECTHSAGTYIEREEADCIHKGAINIFCTACGELQNSQTLPLAAHTYKKSQCTVCGIVCSKHSYYPEVRVEATCEENGAVTKTCKECGFVKNVKTLKADGHDFDISVPGLVATCTVDGYTPHRVCENCGEPNDDYSVLKADGHKLTTVEDVAATCAKDGVLTQKCENCEYVNTEIREHTGHSYAEVAAKEPTCEEAGHNAYKACVNCGKKKNFVSIPATGAHSYVSVEGKAPTCVEAGYSAHQKCVNCGYKNGYAAIEPTGSHTYVNGQCFCGAIAPSYSGGTTPSVPGCSHTSKSTYYTSSNCTQAGYKVVTCDTCHIELSRDITPATGHIEKKIRQEPTCTEAGFERVICEVCNARISNTVLSHVGHNYVNGICSTCSSADPNRFTSDVQDIFLVG